MKRIYVAGPYSEPDPEANTKLAIETGMLLMDNGYAPFIPHLYHFCHKREYEKWMDQCFTWLPLCAAVLRLPGKSAGSDREVALAHYLKLPVFGSVFDLMKAVKP